VATNRTGIVILTVTVKKICHVLVVWRTHIDAIMATAVSTSVITSAQAATVKSFLDLAAAACDVLRLVSGY
jgi:hypothetical protein